MEMAHSFLQIPDEIHFTWKTVLENITWIQRAHHGNGEGSSL